jgi:hypothetical protein
MTNPASLLDLRHDSCRYPLEFRDPEHGLLMYCGQPRAHRETFYCAEHHAVCCWRKRPRPVPIAA